MLQSLGSSRNSKIAGFMFAGCCVLIILTIVFVATFERTIIDDSFAYCATAFYSPKTRYRIEYWGQRNDFDRIDTGCARACYKEQKSTNGLSFLEIETQSGYADVNQAVAAGILEGSLTWMAIYAQWKNTIESFCERESKFCTWLRAIIVRNKANIMSITKRKHHSSHYQHQIMLFYQQLEGIELGFKKGVKRARKDFEIPSTDFLLLNARVDIEDLIVYYNKYVEEDEENFVDITDSAEKMIIKLVDGEHPRVLIGHSSDGDYNSMLKIIKTYRFNYHQAPNDNHLVANTDITFTSYPGVIASTDDFYLAHGKQSRIIVSGIKMKYNQSTQVHAIDIDAAVLMSVRVMAANRLAHNGKSWSRVMARDPDIGAKQWLVIDEKHLKYLEVADSAENDEFVASSSTTDEGLVAGENEIPVDQPIPMEKEQAASLTISSVSSKNIIWLIDNTWKRLHAEDVTSRFKKDGEWTLDGTPYFKVIQELNRIDGKDMKNNNQQQSIEDMDDVASMLQEQAFRGDLDEEDPEPFGNTDIKVYSSNGHQFLVKNGPTSKSEDDIFEWSSFDKTSHDELPESWDFPPVFVQYVWN